MGNKTQLDQLATAYKKVRDATFTTENITNAEKIAVLELVKFEVLRDCQSQLDKN